MITIRNLSFAFKKKQPLFTGLNLDLGLGRTYGLFGLNGVGKSTLLNLVSGMLFPDRGECLISGTASGERRPGTLSKLYIVPEQFELPPVNTKEYVSMQAPFYPDFDQHKLHRILDEFNVESESRLTELSYGQRKKFLIAFGLAANTQNLLLDEPTNGLDIPSKSQFRKILAANGPEDRCTIISTHQVRDLNSIIDQVTVLNDGRIIFNQSVEAISEALIFKKYKETAPEGRIYGEEILGGESAICLKKDQDQDTDIDLELLFNGIIQSPGAINRAFQIDDS